MKNGRIKSKRKQRIVSLCRDPTYPKSPKVEDDSEKADTLGKYFSSVFILEPKDNVPNIEQRLTEPE